MDFLIGPFLERPTQAVPERFQIRIIKRRPFNSVFVNGHRLLEPSLTNFQPSQLRLVAGEVIGDRPHSSFQWMVQADDRMRRGMV